MYLWCCACHSFILVLRKVYWFSNFPTYNLVHAHELKASICLFLLPLSWSMVSFHSFGALQTLIFWQVKLTGQKWEKSVLFFQTAAFMLLIHLLLLNGFIMLRKTCYIHFMNPSWVLSDLVIVYAIKHWGEGGSCRVVKLGWSLGFFDAEILFCELLQQ